jgi:hypothetical protein
MTRLGHDGDGQGGDGIIALVRETADGLGRLVADHIKLARTEIVADAKSYGRQIAVLMVGVFILALGYGLVCLAVALALGPVIGRALAFVVVGGVHVIAGGWGAAIAARRMRRTQLMRETVVEVGRSVTALSAPAEAAPPAARTMVADGTRRRLA